MYSADCLAPLPAADRTALDLQTQSPHGICIALQKASSVGTCLSTCRACAVQEAPIVMDVPLPAVDLAGAVLHTDKLAASTGTEP